MVSLGLHGSLIVIAYALFASLIFMEKPSGETADDGEEKITVTLAPMKPKSAAPSPSSTAPKTIGTSKPIADILPKSKPPMPMEPMPEVHGPDPIVIEPMETNTLPEETLTVLPPRDPPITLPQVKPSLAEGKPNPKPDGNVASRRSIGATIKQLLPPAYPLISRRLNQDGVVVLEVEVMPDGKIGQILVLEDPGHPALVRACLEAARSASYTPASFNGQPVRSKLTLPPFRFKLR